MGYKSAEIQLCGFIPVDRSLLGSVSTNSLGSGGVTVSAGRTNVVGDGGVVAGVGGAHDVPRRAAAVRPAVRTPPTPRAVGAQCGL